MKRKGWLTILAFLLTSGLAHAEHKLLVTDVLDAKEVEAQADYSVSHASAGATYLGQFKLSLTADRRELRNSLSVGLGYGLEMTAFLPFIFSDRRKDESFVSGVPRMDLQNNLGDLGVGLKYRLSGGKEKPMTWVVGLDVEFDTAEDDRAGTNGFDFTPYLAASAALPNGWRPFAMFQSAIRSGGVSDIHTLKIGTEKILNQMFTLLGDFQASFITAHAGSDRSASFSLGLGAYINLYRDLYVIPSVRYLMQTRMDLQNGDIEQDTLTATRWSLGLYYLFN
jgi:hypothetical protein